MSCTFVDKNVMVFRHTFILYAIDDHYDDNDVVVVVAVVVFTRFHIGLAQNIQQKRNSHYKRMGLQKESNTCINKTMVQVYECVYSFFL